MKTAAGQRKCLEWMGFCFDLGWTKEEVIKLRDLWLKYHNQYGKLKNKLRMK